LGTTNLARVTLFVPDMIYLDELRRLDLYPRHWPDTSDAELDEDSKGAANKGKATEGTHDLATAADPEIKKENGSTSEQDVKVKTESGYHDAQVKKEEEDEEDVSFVSSRPAKRARKRN
jgi:hypothetical protein